MKLLYITQMYPSKELPQYCIFLHLQVKALMSRGVDITVVIPATEGESRETEYDGVKVIYLNYRDYSRSALYGLVSFQLHKELKKFIDVSEYDAIFAVHAAANILWFDLCLARKANKPLIVNYRGNNIFEEYKKEPKVFLSNPVKVREEVVKGSSLSIGVSGVTVNVIKERFPDAPVAVVHNGVDSALFSSESQESRPGELHILCAANLIPIKGHKYLFDAVKSLCEKFPDIKLITDVVGRGPYENELKKYIEDNDIPNVIFHGYVHHDKVAQFMKDTDIFVLPSIFEAFGNVVLEAMACKKPVVIFKGQGMDDYVTDGVNGMAAKTGDTADLTAKLELLIKDPELRKTLAENARETARRLTWDASAVSMIRAIEGVL